MLLTLKQPVQSTYKPFHDYSPPTPPSTSRFSPALAAAGPPLPTASTSGHLVSQLMSNPHRGLPPPAAMTLPPGQGPPPLQPPALSQSLGQLPAPPQQWQGAEESMRNWLQAKSEEDKRKQEEEKTRQESLRLEQRKIEQDMLRTSLSGGIPPYMIPMVFAGMGGGNLPNASLEWAQHYMAQAHHLQQQQQMQQQPPPPALPAQAPQSPELRRETRQITHSYSSQPSGPPPVPSTPIGPSGPQNYLPSYPLSPTSRSRNLPGPSSGARQSQSSQLPRINTGEMQAQQPPSGPSSMQIAPGQSAHPLSQSQSAQPSPHQQPQSSPSIYFHHWQPPTSAASASAGNNPTTPSESSYASPRKRKAQGSSQQPAPPSSSQPQSSQPQHAMSPSFSQTESTTSGTPSSTRPRRGHSRQRSDLSSARTEGYGRHRERLVEDRHGDVPHERMGGSRRRSNFDETRRNEAERERERDRAAKRDDGQD